MIAARQRDTVPELRLRSELHRLGLRFRVHRAVLPGLRRKADIVFGPARLAVFVDGCFWHSCPIHATKAKANAQFWLKKLAANHQRDRDTDRRLKAAKWKVVRVWEHEEASRAALRVLKLVNKARERDRTA